MLRYHEDQGEVVHAKRGVEELIRVHKEDDILHGVLNELRVRLCDAYEEV